MCASFEISKSWDELSETYNAEVTEYFPFKNKIYPYSKAPVLIRREQKNLLVPMGFSLVPSWSKEPKVKFASYNARVETLETKATWKKSLSQKRCLVPINFFYEAIYEGEFANSMVAIYQKNEKILTAAGLYDEWLDKETGEILNTFAIVTSAPPSAIEIIGHDRCPIFPKPEFWDEWLEPSKKDPFQIKVKLQENSLNEEIEFNCFEDRKLKSSKRS